MPYVPVRFTGRRTMATHPRLLRATAFGNHLATVLRSPVTPPMFDHIDSGSDWSGGITRLASFDVRLADCRHWLTTTAGARRKLWGGALTASSVGAKEPPLSPGSPRSMARFASEIARSARKAPEFFTARSRHIAIACRAGARAPSWSPVSLGRLARMLPGGKRLLTAAPAFHRAGPSEHCRQERASWLGTLCGQSLSIGMLS